MPLTARFGIFSRGTFTILCDVYRVRGSDWARECTLLTADPFPALCQRLAPGLHCKELRLSLDFCCKAQEHKPSTTLPGPGYLHFYHSKGEGQKGCRTSREYRHFSAANTYWHCGLLLFRCRVQGRANTQCKQPHRKQRPRWYRAAIFPQALGSEGAPALFLSLLLHDLK